MTVPGDEEMHVSQSPEIPFPAPAPIATPTRSKSSRSAAHAATSALSASAASQTRVLDSDDDGGSASGSASEPDLTNDDDNESTAESWTAGEGETDEAAIEDLEADLSFNEEVTEDDEPIAPRKRKTPVKRKAAPATPAGAAKKAKTASTSTTTTTAKARGAAKKGKAKASEGPDGQDGVASVDYASGDKPSGNASDSSALTPAEDLEEKPKRKQRKPRKPREPKPEPVYVIPDVEKLPNPGYQGRLGYACLNTILRKKKPLPVFCSRTCRIDTIKKNGMEFLKELGKQNMRDLVQLIEWNEANNIRFMRLSSEMFPFASHGEYGYTLEYADEELKAAGELANKYGHRLTTHPGQFTQLGSPRKVVVENAVKDLTYHCEMLDRMGMGKDSVMIIHGGGVFQDKPATLERIRKNYTELLPDNVKGRIVLENDEICYNVDDLLPLCEELNIPLVLDYHHDWIYPRAEQSLEELMPRILATWEKKGIKPKFHLSEPRLGAVTVMERRAHSDRCKKLPSPLPPHADLMIEAKDKEQAVLELHRIYDLQPVVHESLRPPVEIETLRTQGRKSSKKKKAKPADGDGEGEGEEEAIGDEEEGGEGLPEGAVDPDQAMVDVDGAQVFPPVEPSDGKKAKTPVKRGRKPKTEVAEGENGDEKPKTPKAKTPRKSRAKKATAGEDELKADKDREIEEAVKAEPAEAEPIEDMKLKEVPEPIVDSVPCEATAACQENKASD